MKLVDNQYQQKSEVLYTFTLYKFYACLLNFGPNNSVFWMTWNIEIDEIVITFTYQNSKQLKIKDKVNLKLLINK